MWGIRRKLIFLVSSFPCHTYMKPASIRSTHYHNSITAPTLRISHDAIAPSNVGIHLLFSSLTSPSYGNSFPCLVEPEHGSSNDNDDDDDSDDEDIEGVRKLKERNEALVRDTRTLLGVLRDSKSNRSEMKNKLEHCGIRVSQELVGEVLSQVRNDWEGAFTFFLWAGKQPGYAHSVREYHLMIFILGKMRKFDTAWSLIDEMRGGRSGPSLVTPRALLIMIRRYCAVHDVAKAINTFYAHKRFNLEIGIEEFQNLLSALCRYKNVEDAEHLLFCNKNVFPFSTKSFNIILNGWCNVIASPRQAERFWMGMCNRGIPFDVISYASIISCYSKLNNLDKVFCLFNQMRRMGISPDRKVYNAVIHALAKGRLVKEAHDLMKQMEDKGIPPNAVTYNSLIKPLCKAQNIDEAREVFDEMVQRHLSPSVRTFHAFFRILRTGEEVFLLLDKMIKTGCPPNNDTFIMLIRKFCRWRQLDNVFKLWSEMGDYGISPDRSSYIVLVHGLFLNGNLEVAYKYYSEMKEKLFMPEPKIEDILQAWVAGKQTANCQLECVQSSNKARDNSFKILDQERELRRRSETRRVVRDRGFSFWEH